MPLYLLAMDHRASLAATVYRIKGDPNPAQVKQIAAGKELVYQGLVSALGQGAASPSAAVLVDERYGEPVARQANAAAITLAMPIEKSGQEWFTLEYGTLGEGVWMEHVEAFDPRYVKILVRDNPTFDVRARRRQMDDLATVSQVLTEAGRDLLLELVVPATPAQESATYDADLRPELTVRLIGEMQAAGVEPAIWKIEGLSTTADATRVLATARQGGRNDVQCIVLGRDAPPDDLDHWLRAAAPAGFLGFAIGRSIWQEPLEAFLTGDIGEQEVVAEVANNYLHYVGVYEGV
ncbi:2-deoxy-5-keto-D-gluconate 6-phosphate aldolase domain-containing protein [Asanoa sp. NPDC049573]|uniref:2-deoxy-5-keto-D-gluconate 6-phosphate aldolase domain-containing protein n=1 Tax=Asanoa sp. NPDC049573 TaxID=3155396 RepID=UPI00341D4FCF